MCMHIHCGGWNVTFDACQMNAVSEVWVRSGLGAFVQLVDQLVVGIGLEFVTRVG